MITFISVELFLLSTKTHCKDRHTNLKLQRRSSHKMSLSALPFDIILQIAEAAGITAVLALRLVNRPLYEVIFVHEAQIVPILLRQYHTLAAEGFEATALRKSIAIVHNFKELSRLDLACELAKRRALIRPSRTEELICHRKLFGLGPLGLDLMTRLERGIDVFEGFVKSKSIVIKDGKVQYRLRSSMSLIEQYNEVHLSGKKFLDGVSMADVINYKILYYCAATAILRPSSLHCEKCWKKLRPQSHSQFRSRVIPRPRAYDRSRMSILWQNGIYLLKIAKNQVGKVCWDTCGSLWSRTHSIVFPRRKAPSHDERIQDLLRRSAPMDRDQWSQVCMPVMLKLKICDLRMPDNKKALAFLEEAESFSPPGARRFEVFWPY